MATIVRMPEVATGTGSAAIQAWLVDVGDEIGAGQPIAEIETEKAVVEYEAEDAGILAEILLPVGDAAAVGTPIAILADVGQSAADALREVAAETGGVAPAHEAVAPADATAAPVPADDAPPRIFASPLVRRLARERGLDLARLSGSGPNGRIVRRDLDAVGGAEPAATTTPPAPSTPSAAAVAPQPDAGFTDIPHTGMRRAIARRLTESTSTVPHFFLVADCRVDALLALRAELAAQTGLKVTVNDMVVKAVAGALRDVPDANAIWTDDATRRFGGVDVAVAVSVPGGLLTPVVRGVERLSLGELSATIRELVGRAREGRLQQRELEGGSFSVSNLGGHGIQQFSAIINPPHAGILAVGAASRRPVVGDDGELAVATVMTVTLSADHRVLDGVLAAQWLAAFVTRIENPLTLLV